MSTVPPWLDPLRAAVATIRPEELSRFLPPPEGGRESAVLVLFAEGPAGPDVLLVQRAEELRSHAGQAAFPGGSADPGDDGPVGTALREAWEETGVRAEDVTVLAELPRLFLPPSGFVVTPVLAWWHRPSAVVLDATETAHAERIPVGELVDPAHRHRWRHPRGHLGPAFEVRGMFVWGFTAGLLDRLLTLGGWTRPWAEDDVRDLPPRVLARLDVPVPR